MSTHWLLLRGLARESRHWNDFPQRLRAGIADAKVTCLDLPGTGLEHRRPSPTTIRGIVEDVRSRWLWARGPDQRPPFVLGISLGGMVALEWAAAYPEDFQGAVLLNTSAADVARPWERMHPRVVAGMTSLVRVRDPILRERGLLALTSARRERHAEIAARWAVYATERPMRRRVLLQQLVAAASFRAPARLYCPLLFLSGAQDVLARPIASDRLSSRFRAPHHQHPDAGHDLSIDAPDWAVERVAHWLEQQRALGGLRDED